MLSYWDRNIMTWRPSLRLQCSCNGEIERQAKFSKSRVGGTEQSRKIKTPGDSSRCWFCCSTYIQHYPHRYTIPSVLQHCWVGDRTCIWPVKNLASAIKGFLRETIRYLAQPEVIARKKGQLNKNSSSIVPHVSKKHPLHFVNNSTKNNNQF